MYKVVKFFTDLQDNNHAYHVGDIFPREGVEVSEDRLKELSSTDNKRGEVLIEKDTSEEGPGEAKEEPLEEEAGVDSPKKPKAKKTPKKA